MNRKIYYWKLAASEMQLGDRTLVMGVINLTPDSFSDGGRYNDPDLAYARALELEEAGADIIDLGAESTRPGSTRISADEEWQRLVPVLKKLKGNLRVPLSLDTYKSEIAERALQYGVEILNDPSGLTFDPGLAKVAAHGNVGLILNHMRGAPESWAKMPPMKDPIGTIAKELDATISRARLAGVERNRIVIDPGLGFGKRKEQNSEIIGRLAELAGLDYPILVGASRKSFLAQPTEKDTIYATAAAVAVAAMNGAHIVRVHDVAEMRAVIVVTDEILKAVIAGTKLPDPEEKPVSRPREMNREDERPRPPRPPLMKPVVVAPPAEVVPAEVVPAEVQPVEATASEVSPAGAGDEMPVVEIAAETASEAAAADETPTETAAAPVKPAFKKPAEEPKPFRTPGKFSEDREKFRDAGFRPPSRPPFRQDRPQFDRPPSDRPQFDRPQFDRPRAGGPPPRRDRDFRPGGPRNDGPPKRSFDRGPASGGDRPRFDRPQGDRPRFDRPPGDRPRFDRPPGDRPQGDRPRFDRPPGDRPRFDRPGGGPRFDRPAGDRPRFDGPPGDRPRFSRPPGGAPPREGFRPGGRPDSGPPRREGFRPGGPPRSNDRDDRRPPFGGGRPSGDRPGGDRPGGGRPGGPPRSGPPNRPFRKRP